MVAGIVANYFLNRGKFFGFEPIRYILEAISSSVEADKRSREGAWLEHQPLTPVPCVKR